MIKLAKVGNLKLGLVRNGKPIATNRILVTKATKEGEENFLTLDGFPEDGLETVDVQLVFDTPSLNFETGLTGFLEIAEIPYISKVMEDKIVIFPLNLENEDEKTYVIERTDENIEGLSMKQSGLLRVMLNGYSGFGEVFYLKTHSLNTIDTISSQLEMYHSLTGGKLAGINFKLRTTQKDVEEKNVTFVSLSCHDISGELSKRLEDPVNYKAFEELYKQSRMVKLTEISSEEFFKLEGLKIDRGYEDEVAQIKRNAEEISVDSDLEEIVKAKGVKIRPILLKNLYEKMDREEFLAYLTEDLTVRDVVLKNAEVSRA